jgi:hypothetical protein
MGRRWRALTTALVAIGAVVALTATRVDPGMWPAYPNAVLETLSRPTISVTASQSTLSLARRLCVPDLEWNPHGPARCPTAAKIVPGVLILIALAVTAWISREVPMQTWLSAGIVLSVLSGPMAEDYHFAVLAVPIVLLLSASAPNVGALGVIAVLLFLPLRLTAFRFQDGWWSVLAYPRLYAAWLLWAIHAFGVRKHFRRLRSGPAAEPRFY